MKQFISSNTIAATSNNIPHAFVGYACPSLHSIRNAECIFTVYLPATAFATAMGVQRKHVNELCNNRRAVTAATALILSKVFGNSPDFWLNVQRRTDLWEAMHSPRERERIDRARPLNVAA